MDDDELTRNLREWTADARFEVARRQRTTTQWQRQLAAGEARFSGLLLDLAERHVPVAIATESNRRLHGVLDEVGCDFVTLLTAADATVHLSIACIVSVDVAGSAHRLGAPSFRESVSTRSLADVLVELADDELRARVYCRGSSEGRAGRLASVGVDVITLVLDGDAPRTLFIATDSVTELAES